MELCWGDWVVEKRGASLRLGPGRKVRKCSKDADVSTKTEGEAAAR